VFTSYARHSIGFWLNRKEARQLQPLNGNARFLGRPRLVKKLGR
jgi:hypothetical protein